MLDVMWVDDALGAEDDKNKNWASEGSYIGAVESAATGGVTYRWAKKG